MNIKDSLLFYAITDRGEQSESEFLADIEKSLQSGITMLQLREKYKSSEEIIALGKKVKSITDSYCVPLIIDDDVYAAKVIDAAGVHLGQEDMSAAEARQLLGKDKIIGITAKTVEQAQKAEADGADYLGSGRMFVSQTKENAAAMSYELLREICRSVNIPVCAIGGIEKGNIEQLYGSGIAGIAICKGIFAAKDMLEEGKAIKELLKNL